MPKNEALEKTDVVLFLKWVTKSCDSRRTSRSNIYSVYWQLRSTAVLYTDEEILEYWLTEVKK